MSDPTCTVTAGNNPICGNPATYSGPGGVYVCKEHEYLIVMAGYQGIITPIKVKSIFYDRLAEFQLAVRGLRKLHGSVNWSFSESFGPSHQTILIEISHIGETIDKLEKEIILLRRTVTDYVFRSKP